MGSPLIQLDIGFHTGAVDEYQQVEFQRRFEDAAAWIANRFALECLSVSISIVDDPTIHRLNLQHLQHDWPTDVISFAFDSGPKTSGEIIASWDTAQRLSQIAGWRDSDELLLYVLHGLLHIVGLDDVAPEDKFRMRQLESEFLMAAGVAGAADYLARFDDVSY